MESALRTALIGWLRDDPFLAARINTIEEESPVQASPPWLGIAASAAADWSCKDRRGREVRVALELFDRGDDPAATGDLAWAVEQRIAALMPEQPGFLLVSVNFLRSRTERRPRGARAVLLEYRFLLLERQVPADPGKAPAYPAATQDAAPGS